MDFENTPNDHQAENSSRREGSMENADTTGNKLVLARDLYPETLPVIPIRGQPMFPRITMPLALENAVLANALSDRLRKHQKYVGIVLRRADASEDNGASEGQPPSPDSLCRVGVLGEIVQVARPNEKTLHILLNTLERIRILDYTQTKPFLVARIDYLLETEMSGNAELKAYSISVMKSIKELVQLNPLHKEELNLLMQNTNLSEPGRLADIATALTTAEGPEKQDVLETVSIRERLQKVLLLLRKEVDVSRIQTRIGKQIEEKLSKHQRDFFLREQLKAIKKELGIEKEGKETEVDRFEKRIDEIELSPEARDRVREELEKLRLLETASPEFTVTRNYLDWLTCLPWGVFTDDALDIPEATRILDDDHYGLEDVKERILEFLAVGKLRGGVGGSILCFVGPPGVGKTSLGRSIARSIGRNFYRFSVGGIRDEAEIKGHRRTYIGAMPGKFIQVMKTCGSANPVIMLDEIDKIGASYHGDPASALLEVLDPEQNVDFLDHYLDVRFNLSNVFFICTANQLDTIPRPLLDRMEVIHLAGYIEQEKVQIAKKYLVPKQRQENGLLARQFFLTTAAVRKIINGYAREPGVRNLEKQIGKIMRKSARRIVEHDFQGRIRVDAVDVEPLLGKRHFVDDADAVRPAVGVVTGLAWTSLGGDTLSVEAIAIASDKPGFKHTGQLGGVMVESSEIAYSYVRSLLRDDPKRADFFVRNALHLHVPAGATPKDGPSAGITMATALYSLVTRRPVRKRLAMTGELTLTGRIMPIGGVKEKVLAARRARIRTIVLPDENRRDFEDLPDHLRRGLDPKFVRRFEDVIRLCFGKLAGS